MKRSAEHSGVAEILGFRGRFEENTDFIRNTSPTDFMLLFSLEGHSPIFHGRKVSLQRCESQPVTSQCDKWVMSDFLLESKCTILSAAPRFNCWGWKLTIMEAGISLPSSSSLSTPWRMTDMASLFISHVAHSFYSLSDGKMPRAASLLFFCSHACLSRKQVLRTDVAFSFHYYCTSLQSCTSYTTNTPQILYKLQFISGYIWKYYSYTVSIPLI